MKSDFNCTHNFIYRRKIQCKPRLGSEIEGMQNIIGGIFPGL